MGNSVDALLRRPRYRPTDFDGMGSDDDDDDDDDGDYNPMAQALAARNLPRVGATTRGMTRSRVG